MNEPIKYPVNTSEQVGPGGVFVCFSSGDRRGSVPASQIVQVGQKTDPEGPWYNYGNKTFLGKRSESFPKAVAWATERFGIQNWRRNGAGDYIDASKEYLPLRRDIERQQQNLKLFNGSIGRGAHGYVAAQSRADARRVLQDLGHTTSDAYLRDYWHPLWGGAMVGITPERGLWVQVEYPREPPVRITSAAQLRELLTRAAR